MSAKKKVIFCTYSSIYSSKVLEQLIVDTDINLVAIINSTRIFRPSLNHVQGAVSQRTVSPSVDRNSWPGTGHSEYVT